MQSDYASWQCQLFGQWAKSARTNATTALPRSFRGVLEASLVREPLAPHLGNVFFHKKLDIERIELMLTVGWNG